VKSIRRIVVGTDFSAPAGHAVSRAAELAESHGASLTLVHVVEASAMDHVRRLLDGKVDVRHEAEEAALTHLRAIAASVAKAHPIRVDEHLGTGHPVRVISAVADEARADLVVCGSQGAGLIERMIGSTAERIVRTSFRPVLLVKRAPLSPYRRLLIPVDFSAWSETSIQAALRLVPAAQLSLLHSIDTSWIGRLTPVTLDDALVREYQDRAREEAADHLMGLATRLGLTANQYAIATTVDADPWDAILQQAHDQDLIVMGKEGRSAFGELLLGSVTHKVTVRSDIDVLIAARGDTIVTRPA
jgi:nucleotide-binding universal stress UspA family protein